MTSIQSDEDEPETQSDNTAENEQTSPTLAEPATINAEAASEVDEEFLSEEEILDEAFQDSEQLDPTALHADEETVADDHATAEADFTEEHTIAAQLTTPSERRRRKNFLQKRYKITHFWPRSWERKWAADRACKDNEQFLENS